MGAFFFFMVISDKEEKYIMKKIKHAYYYMYDDLTVEFANVKTLEDAIIKGYTLFPRPKEIWVSIDGTLYFVFEYQLSSLYN